MKTPEPTHLEYLLTAYLLDSLSPAGRREVEEHLTACAACRAEMEDLRDTLQAVQGVLGPGAAGAGEYSFEECRRQRVLAARGSSGPLNAILHRRIPIRWIAISLGSVAAIILALATILPTLMTARGRFPGSSNAVMRYSESTPEGDSYLALGVETAAPMPPTDATATQELPPAVVTAIPEAPAVPPPPAAEPQPAPGVSAGLAAIPAPAAPKAPALEVAAQTGGLGVGGGSGDAGRYGGRFGGKRGALKMRAGSEEAQAAGGQPAGPGNAPAQAVADPGAVADAKPPAVRELSDEALSKTKDLAFGTPGGSLANQQNEKDELKSGTVTFSEKLDLESKYRAKENSGVEDLPKLARGAKVIDGISSSTAAAALAPTKPAPGDKKSLQAVRGDRLFDDSQEAQQLQGRLESRNGQLEEEGRKWLTTSDGRMKIPAHEVEALKRAVTGTDFDTFGFKDASRKKVWELNGDGTALWGDSAGSGIGRLGDQAWFLNSAAEGAALGRQADDGRQAALAASLAPERILRAYRYWKATDPSLTLERFAARLQPIPRPEIGDEGLGQEGFRKRHGVNPFVDTRRDHLSTFGMDVSTASYTLARSTLRAGRLPDPPTIRVEEFVNFFKEDLKADPEQVFSVASEGGPSPFRDGVELLKITVKARELLDGERKPAVLTFLVDTSGSMASGTASASLDNRAPEAPSSGDAARIAMVRRALHTLVDSLGPDDRIGIAGFSGQAYLVLSHTPARERERILAAIDSLSPRGATNVEAGLDLAYRLADEVFQPRAVNRVILLSDGVANVGERGPDEILKKVQVFAQRGIYLSSVGVGMGRYNDRLLEALATRGNGNYAYVDSEEEAVRIFCECLPSTLQVLAQDAKVQVDFNPEVVDLYRLLGYEKRDIADQDFRNDKIDAGEVGPGTTVTVLYEVRRRTSSSGDLGRIRLRYLDMGTGRVEETDYPLSPGVLATGLAATSPRFRLIAAAAQCAELLRGSHWSRGGSFGTVLALLGTVGAPERDRPEWKDLLEIASRAQALTVESLAAGK